MRALRTGLPGLFAVAALTGMGLTLASLISTPAVDIGSFRSVGHDALSLYLGHGLYHDPAGGGYTGLLYTPLLPGLVSLLDHLAVWSAWPPLISVLATGALGALVAAVALRAAGSGRGPWTPAGAAGMGGAAVWLATSTVGFLYFGWTDELAWAFAVGGLVAGSAAHRSRSAAAATVALFTLAFWSKQTTLAAPVAYTAWLLVLSFQGVRRPRFTATQIGLLLGTNLLVLGILALASGGWEPYFNFTLPARHARIYGLGQFASDVSHVVSIPALFALLIGAPALHRGRRRLRLDDLASLLVVFVALGLPCAMYFRSKQGGNPNQYLGVIWALGALAALAWGRARRGAQAGALFEDAVVLVALLGAVLATAIGGGRFDLHLLRMDYRASIPAPLRSLARSASLFHPFYTDLVPGEVYPDVFNAADLLAAGEQPMGLLRALLHRRFDLVASYTTAVGPSSLAQFNLYAGAFGAREANYFWKLDQVIVAGYRPARGLPAGILERRDAPNRAAALAACFGPFQLAGAAWRIRAGGGFWCRSASNTITLGSAPATRSELVTDASLVAAGTLALSAHPGAGVYLSGGGNWAVFAHRDRAGWSVLTRRAGGRPVLQRTALDRLTLNLGGGGGLRVDPDPLAARISIIASTAAGVRLDLGALRLRP